MLMSAFAVLGRAVVRRLAALPVMTVFVALGRAVMR